ATFRIPPYLVGIHTAHRVPSPATTVTPSGRRISGTVSVLSALGATLVVIDSPCLHGDQLRKDYPASALQVELGLAILVGHPADLAPVVQHDEEPLVRQRMPLVVDELELRRRIGSLGRRIVGLVGRVEEDLGP